MAVAPVHFGAKIGLRHVHAGWKLLTASTTSMRSRQIAGELTIAVNWDQPRISG